MDIRDNFSEEWGDPSEVRRHVEKFGGDPTDLSDVKAFILYLFASRVRHHDFSLGCGYGGGPGNRTSGGGQRTSFSNVKRQLYHHFTTAVDTRYDLNYVWKLPYYSNRKSAQSGQVSRDTLVSYWNWS